MAHREVPGTPWPIGQMFVLPRHLRLFLSCLCRYVSCSPTGTGMGPRGVPGTPWPIGQMSVFLSHLRLFSVLLVQICFLQPRSKRAWDGSRP